MEMEEVKTITTMIGIQNGDTIHCLQGNRGKRVLFYRNIFTAVERMKAGRSKMKIIHPSQLKEIIRAVANRIVRRVNDDSDPSMVVTVRAVDKFYVLLTKVAVSLTNDNNNEWINNGKSDDNDDDRRLLDALLFLTFGQIPAIM